MDVYRLPEGHPKTFPEWYRFSRIAYDTENEMARVLFDCHEPKGPHTHVDDDGEGMPFDWKSIEAAYDLFFERVKERFGAFDIEEES